MTTAIKPDAEAAATETMADLLERLGNVAPSRIRMHPAPGTAAVRDVVEIEAREKRLFELVDGVLVEKGMGYRESYLALAIAYVLQQWVLPRNLGIVAGEAGMMRFKVSQVRIPDVSYISWDRLPGRMIPKEAVPELSPELVVEVLSESNTKSEMERKRGDYFAAGVKLVWEVDGDERTISVYNGDKTFMLTERDTLDGGDVLPGFTLKLADLFGRLDGAPSAGR